MELSAPNQSSKKRLLRVFAFIRNRMPPKSWQRNSLLQWVYVGIALIGVALFPQVLPERLLPLAMLGLVIGFALISPPERYSRFLPRGMGFSLSLFAMAIFATAGSLIAEEYNAGSLTVPWFMSSILFESVFWVMKCGTMALIEKWRIAGGFRGLIENYKIDAALIAGAAILGFLITPYWAGNPDTSLEDVPTILFIIWAGAYAIWYPLKRNGLGLSVGLLFPLFTSLFSLSTFHVTSDAAAVLLPVFFGLLMAFGAFLWWSKKGIVRLIHFARHGMTAKHWRRLALAIILLAAIGWRGYVTYRIVSFKAEYSQENYPEIYVLPKTRKITSSGIPATKASRISWRRITFTAPWPGAYLEKEASEVARYAFPSGERVMIIEPFAFSSINDEETESKAVRRVIVNLFKDITSVYAFEVTALNTTPDGIGLFTPSWVFFRKRVFVIRKSQMPMSTGARSTFIFSTPNIKGLQTTSYFPETKDLRIYDQTGRYVFTLRVFRPDSQKEVDFIISSIRLVEPPHEEK